MCVSVMCSDGNNVCGTTASVHIHLHGKLNGLAFLHRQSKEFLRLSLIPEIVSSIPAVVRYNFQLARCEYKLRVTPQT